MNALLHACAKARKVDLAISLFKEHQAIMDLVSFNTLVNVFCEAGEVQKACDLVAEARKSGTMMTTITVNTLIKAFAAADDVKRCWELIAEAVRDGVEINQVSFGSIATAYLKRRDIKSTMALIERMSKEYGVAANTFIYNSALKTAALCNDRGTGLRIIKMMTSRDDFTNEKAALFKPPIEISHLPFKKQQMPRTRDGF